MHSHLQCKLASNKQWFTGYITYIDEKCWMMLMKEKQIFKTFLSIWWEVSQKYPAFLDVIMIMTWYNSNYLHVVLLVIVVIFTYWLAWVLNSLHCFSFNFQHLFIHCGFIIYCNIKQRVINGKPKANNLTLSFLLYQNIFTKIK